MTILLLSCMTSCKNTTPKDQSPTVEKKAQKFDIGMVTFAGYAPLYLAKEKGFFGDLQVELHRIDEVPSIRTGVINGELEAYLGTVDIAMDTNKAAPGQAVWAIDESSGGDGVVVTGGLKNLSDLIGKKVAAEPGLPPSFILQYLLYKNGISINDVTLLDMSTQDAATAFIGGKVDAAGIYEPFLSSAQKKREGSQIIVSSAAPEMKGMIVDLIFASKKTIKTRPNDITKVIEGWKKSLEFIKTSPDQAYQIMAKSFDLKVDEFKDIAAGVRWLGLKDNQELFGTEQNGILFESFNTVMEVLKKNRSSVYPATSKEYLNSTFVK